MRVLFRSLADDLFAIGRIGKADVGVDLRRVPEDQRCVDQRSSNGDVEIARQPGLGGRGIDVGGLRVSTACKPGRPFDARALHPKRTRVRPRGRLAGASVQLHSSTNGRTSWRVNEGQAVELPEAAVLIKNNLLKQYTTINTTTQ